MPSIREDLLVSIHVHALTKFYGAQKAIDQLTFRVEAAEIVGILGPNGAGKSTTMKIICSYLIPSSGHVTVCGYDTVRQSKESRRQIGYLPENNPLYSEMYVEEFLLFTARLSGVAHRRQKVRETIELVHLTAERHKKIGALSKGYRQRVGLAHALLHDPPVLILDEPTAGLDPLQVQEIRSLIRSLGKKKTVLLSTHIMQEVEALCSRVIILNRGVIVADDSVHNLMRAGQGQQKFLIAFRDRVTQESLQAIPGILQVEAVGSDQWSVTAAEPIAERLFQFAVDQQTVLTLLQQQHAGLEDVFRKLTTPVPSTDHCS